MFENDYLMHYGIKGQKWGVRRYQNSDGSWTAAGRVRYSKGNGKRAKYGSQLDPETAKRVEDLNIKINAANANYQRSHAGRQAIMDTDTGKAAVRAGLSQGIGTALAGTGLMYALASNSDVEDKLKLAGKFGLMTGLAAGGGAAAGTALGTKIAKRDIRNAGPISKISERYVQDLVAKRNVLDPSQMNRKGRTLTKEEYSDYYNQVMNNLGSTRKHKGLVSDDQYNKYLRETVAYGSKKNAKYGSQLDPKTAKRVEELNKQIDKENLKLQKRNARTYGYDQASIKKAAIAGAANNALINGVVSRNRAGFTADLLDMDPSAAKSFGRSAAVADSILGAGSGAAGGALKAAIIKAAGKSSIGKTSRETKIKRMVAERNSLDPSQASRKGRTLTEKEFAKQVNATKGAVVGGSAGLAGLPFSPIGAAVGSKVGSLSKKSNSYDYNDYLKNTTTYGSKKKRR